MSPSTESSPTEELKPQDPAVGPDSEDWPGHMCGARHNAPLQASKYRASNAMMASSNLLWDNGELIKFCFIKPSGTKVQRDKVLTTIKEWEKYANIKFKLVEKPASAMIRVAFDTALSPHSLIGKEVGARQKEFTVPTLNLGPSVSHTQDAIGDDERGTILHEFGHALGFLHEHQSIRMGEKMKLFPDRLLNFFTNVQNWTPEDVQTQILARYDEKDVSSYSAVDTKSIMIYAMPAKMNSFNQVIRANPQLSEKDKAFAFLNYPFLNGKVSPDPEWNISRALKAVGAEGEWRERLLAEYEQGDWKGLRLEFSYFCKEERARALDEIAAAEKATSNKATSSEES